MTSIPASGRYYSPLRYPGGKQKLVPFIEALVERARLSDAAYAEPYAGGAAVALTLLMREFVSTIHINDISRPLYCFWKAVLEDTENLCRFVRDSKLTVPAWRRHRAVLRRSHEESDLRVAFATFFLNRTNRSGIIARGGVIGGLEQKGRWRIDARFPRPELVRRIQRIAMYRDRIRLYQLDAEQFMKKVVSKLPARSFTFIDPPYYHGADRLYERWYVEEDHARVAQQVMSLKAPWIVTYDDCLEVRRLYKGCAKVRYNLSYSAARAYQGTEVVFGAPVLAGDLRACARQLL